MKELISADTIIAWAKVLLPLFFVGGTLTTVDSYRYQDNIEYVDVVDVDLRIDMLELELQIADLNGRIAYIEGKHEETHNVQP